MQFSFFFHWQVVGSPDETSRLLLCEATLIVMRQCFNLLGIVPVYRLWPIWRALYANFCNRL